MKILLSTIGSRGDVQPLIALALELRALGHTPRLCAPTNFKEWVESYGLECVPIGPDLKKMTGGTVPGKPVLPTPEMLQKLADQSVYDQFRVLSEAAQGCGLIVAASALQIAARSIAQAQGIPYVFATYCPAVLPSAKYPPPKTGGAHPQDLPDAENLRLWADNDADFGRFQRALNEERAKLGLEPVTHVRDYMFTQRPWLAADPALAPAFPVDGMEVIQTGAWVIPDERDLPEDLERFLAAGAPPVFLGFGSMRASDAANRVLIETARALGLRSILSQGWADLIPIDNQTDCFSIGDVNYEKLFPRVSAVVHHGGAGTTTAAARAGAAQVVVPHNYDQFYWAHRVETLGVGVSGPNRDDLSVEALLPALRAVLQPEVKARAQALSARMESRGTRIATGRLMLEFGKEERGE
jgi:vancomycin aglycone glucosyltransferase